MQHAAGVAVHYEPGMPPSEFWKKTRALLELSGRGVLVKAPNPVPRDSSVVNQFRADMERRIFEQYGSTNPDFASRLQFRIRQRMSPDHVCDLQLGGPDNASNLRFLDRSVNEQLGMRQIWPQIRNLPDGTRITIFVVDSNGVPIKPQ